MRLKKTHWMLLIVIGVLLVAGFLGWRYAVQMESRMFALDAGTGQVQWSTPVNEIAYNHPVASHDQLFIIEIIWEGYPRTYKRLSLDTTTGQRQWEFAFCRSCFVVDPPLVDADVVLDEINDGHETVVVLNATTGEKLWSFSYSYTGYDNSLEHSYALSTNRIVTLTEQGIQAFDKHTSEVLWQQDYDGERASFVANDQMVCVIGRDEISLYDIQTGALQYNHAANDYIHQFQLDGSILYYFSHDVSVSAFDTESHSLLWTYVPPVLASHDDRYISHLQAAEQMVYINIQSWRQNDDGSRDDWQAWLFALDADGHEQWRKKLADIESEFDRLEIRMFQDAGWPAIGAESIFVIRGAYERQRELVALSAADGSEQWRFPLWASSISSPATNGDYVFIMDRAPRWRNWLAHLNPAWHGD